MTTTTPLATGYTEIAGVKLANGKSIEGQNLVLNGAGLRTLALFKVYVAALYLGQKNNNAEEIINSAAPQCIELVLKRDVDAKTISGSFRDALKQNLSKEELQALEARLDELEGAINNIRQIKEGDRLCIDFAGNGLTRIWFNDALKETISGESLSSALLKIWFGKKPVQDNLKKALLGA